MADNGNAVTWRVVVDWGVRVGLALLLLLTQQMCAKLDAMQNDVTELRIDVAAVVQANQQQTSDIASNQSTNVALMSLLNEVTTNVARLTERVAGLSRDVQGLESTLRQ